MADLSPECASHANQLADLALRATSEDACAVWTSVEATAQALANSLRIRDGPVDNQTALGKTLLPSHLSTLLKAASLDASQRCGVERAAAAYELLRVGANMCVDHDENREQLLDAGYLQAVVEVLERYAEAIPPTGLGIDPLPLSIPHLKVVKTAIGVLLNACLGYEPVRFRLISLEAAVTILRLSTSIYPPGRWCIQKSPLDLSEDASDDTLLESWTLRSGLSTWAWRTITELKGDDGSPDGEEVTSPADARPLFGPDILPVLVRPLRAFVPPYVEPQGAFADPARRRALLAADFEVLEEACTLLEALCMDIEDIRLSLARGVHFPDGEHSGVHCLVEMLTFIERGNYPALWETEPEPERQRRQKSFDFCKAAVVKAVVEVAGEEKNTDVLWDETMADRPGGEFVWTMVNWIRAHGAGKDGRDDLVMCGTLCLANLVRREAHSTAIVKPPIALAKDLLPFFTPETDLKVKHGVIGLLKHLSQAAPNRAELGEAGIIQKLATSEIWADKLDLAELVQVSAIGIAKHLCNGNAENTFALVLPAENVPSTALDQILALVKRSESIAVKSEGTRVVVNAVKALWSSDTKSEGERRKQAMGALLTPGCASALAQLVGRSRKYPTLINEGVVALTLLSTHTKGGPLVLDAFLAPLPSEARGASAPVSAADSGSGDSSPVVGPARALDTAVSVLRNREGRFAPEVRANVCVLLGQLGRTGGAGADEARAAELVRLKEQIRPVLQAAADAPAAATAAPTGGAADKPQTKGAQVLAAAAKGALEAWV